MSAHPSSSAPASSTPSLAPIRYLVRVAAGRSRTPDLVLRRNEPRPVFGAGTAAAWHIDAEEVASLHVLFAFNGLDLYVAAAPGAKALLDGEPLPERWVPVRRMARLELGGARIVVLPRPARAPVPSVGARAKANGTSTAVEDDEEVPTDAAVVEDVAEDAVTEPFARDADEGDLTVVASPDVVTALRRALA